jgi:peptidyl-prolyl cis-trans isomerase A (cyclophilin A)
MKPLIPLALVASALCACSKTTAEPTTTAVATAAPAAASAPAPPSASATAAMTASPTPSSPSAATLHPALLSPAQLSEKAPAIFKAKFTTAKGDFVVEVHRDWAPNGADRFYNLVKAGFFDDTRFFRAIEGFMVQFGISGDPALSTKWLNANIPDDPVTQSNKRGFVTFAQRNDPNSRSTQVFINYSDNKNLDGMRFAPFGQVVKGMDVVDSLYKGYGEGAPGGAGPNQGLIQSQGNAYLDTSFPKLDAIRAAVIASK